MTLRSTIKGILTGDATLLATATGGIHDAESVGRNGIERRDLVAAAGDVTIQPGLYIKWTTDNHLLEGIGAREAFFQVFFYQDTGYGDIETMRRRVYDLLHGQRFSAGVDYVYNVRWIGDLYEQMDEALGGVSMERSRFQVHYLRR